MKKFILAFIVAFAIANVTFAAPVDSSVQTDEPPTKVSVVVLPARNIRADAEMMKILEQGIYKKFNPVKYNVQIWGKDSKPEFMEFLEKVKSDNAKTVPAEAVIKKDHCIKYGKDTGSGYVMYVYVFPADMKFAVGLFSYSIKYNTQADIAAFDVNEDKYILGTSYVTPEKGSPKVGLIWVLDTMNQKFVIPPALAR